MNDTITIRRATREDAPRMMELVQELAIYERAPDEVTVSIDHFIESGFGEKPVYWAFVATAGETILGFALYYIRYSTWKGQRMYLEDILVTEKARGKGIGKLLTNECICKARRRQLSQVIIHSTKAMQTAWKMYEGMGFKRSEDLDYTNVAGMR